MAKQWAVRLRVWGLGLVAGAVALVGGLRSAPAAERVVVSFGPLERSIQVEDLAAFAETGELTRQLQAYVRPFNLSAEQISSISRALNTPAPDEFTVVAVAQFLHTPQGKLLLKQISEVLQTPTGRASFSALRGALILAAADEGGLTLLNFLRQYPSEFVRIDLARGLALTQAINRIILQSEQALALVRDQAEVAIATDPLSDDAYDQALGFLGELQRYEVVTEDLPLPQLETPLALYLPSSSFPQLPPRNSPLILISHGLGSDRTTFDYLARYLAGAGFAVATLEHTGSNDRQLFALQEGLVSAVVEDEEFQRRPQEVTYALDAIEAAVRQGSLRGAIDLRRIGVIGQSFGGYTALAVAGAEQDADYLRRRCPPPPPAFNISLLLQCQTPLVSEPERLSDPRIDAVFAVNPIGSALFGPQGYGQIEVPTLVVAGAADTVAPAFPEQITPFTWLQTPARYLITMGGGTHFSVLGEVAPDSEPLPVPDEIIGPEPELARRYMEVFALAFFQRYLREDLRSQPVLTAAFARRVSREPLPLNLVQSLTREQLEAAISGRTVESSQD